MQEKCWLWIYIQEYMKKKCWMLFKRILRKSDECTWFDETGKEIQTLTERFMTEDVLFGYVTNLKLEDYLDADKVAAARKQISEAKRKPL